LTKIIAKKPLSQEWLGLPVSFLSYLDSVRTWVGFTIVGSTCWSQGIKPRTSRTLFLLAVQEQNSGMRYYLNLPSPSVPLQSCIHVYWRVMSSSDKSRHWTSMVWC
jgi:hypothetical protein